MLLPGYSSAAVSSSQYKLAVAAADHDQAAAAACDHAAAAAVAAPSAALCTHPLKQLLRCLRKHFLQPAKSSTQQQQDTATT
jgi:hypothetical protein